MADFGTYGDVTVTLADNCVATAEIQRPPHNFFDMSLIDALVQAFTDLDAESACRAIVLCSDGKNFCAGAQHGQDGKRANPAPATPGTASPSPADAPRHLYDAAYDLFATKTPVVAAVQGAAVGGGLGLACFADFRVAAPEARFCANFARLGFHHGFGLTETLPHLVGQQRALELLYTGRRVPGEEALALGLADRLVPLNQLRSTAHDLAAEIATSAPLAIDSIRQTMRGHLPAAIKVATDREKAEQDRLRNTNDWVEGVNAMSERRTPSFTGS